jgi:hypothetical protein
MVIMKRFKVKFTSRAIIALGIAATSSFAAAQTQVGQKSQTPTPGRQVSPGSSSDIKSLMSGLNIGPLMMSFGGADGSMIDFTRSNERVLLERSDVRSELFIDSKQRETLGDMDQQNRQQLQKKMMDAVMQATINNPDFKALAQLGGSGQQPNFAVVQDVLNTSFETMQSGLQAFQISLDTKEEALLKPNQVKRLHELDLQWRGLLALSDPTVAKDLDVTADEKAVVAEALKTYLSVQLNTLEPLMAQAVQFGQQAASSNSAPRGFDQQEMKRSVSAAMDSDVMTKARTSAESKVKASLTADQLAHWKTMIGKKFYFTRLD